MHWQFSLPSFPLRVTLARKDEPAWGLPMERVPDPVIALDASGRVRNLNPAARRVLGAVPGPLEGRRLNELMPGLEPSILRPDFTRPGTDSSHFDAVIGQGPKQLRFEGSVIEADESGGRLLLLHDVTARESARRGMAEAEANARSAADEAKFLYTIATVAPYEDSSDHAMREVLRLVCRHIEWPVGHVYRVDPENEGRLVPSGIWYSEQPERFDEFRRLTERTPFESGAGLPGRVLSTGKSVWTPDVREDLSFLRRRPSEDLGVRGALGYPHKGRR